MFDHVANQLSNNVNSGSYSNTLVFDGTNEIMTRSISWEVNDCTGIVDIQLIMTEIQLPND